ncbi:peptidoglycan-binding protein [Rhizobium sp. PAMB 3174]
MTSTRHGEQSPLDALSKTIEGLEARIEGLMGAAGRKDPAKGSSRAARTEAADWPRDAADVRQASPSARRFNPVDEILERQRSLEAGRGPVAAPSPRPPLGNRRPAVEPTRASAPMPAAAHAAQPDITDTLQALRHELKRDIADGVAREMTAMRNDLRALKADASDPRYASEIRSELAHLADRVDRLSAQAAPRQAEELRAEFQGLRTALDSMARQDDVNRMQDHLALFENRMQAFDGINVKDDIMALAYRIDDIKMQISSLNSSPAVHALEDKLMVIASAVEQLGNHMRPDHSIDEQFAALNSRMEDIAAALIDGPQTARHPEDSRMIERLDDRIAGLASQIDGISRSLDSRPGETDVLAARIEAMAERIEDLANIEAAARLEERLDHLAQLIEQSQAFGIADGISDYLTEISTKIDAVGGGELSDAITARLDALARQIDELQMPAASDAGFDGAAIQRLEDRLAGIAKRLDEQSARPISAAAGLETLEEQIANLSALMQDLQPAGGSGLPSDFDQRMAAIEDYITTNDEYIIEAARQAAESVLEAYARSGGQPGGADMSALVGLTQDLKNLESLSRNSEERTQQTFGALHETLIQIAERLDHLDAGIRQGGQVRAPAARDYQTEAAPQFAAEPEAAFDDVPEEPRHFGRRHDEDVVADRSMAADVATLEEPAQKASLLSGIGKRLMPSRKEERTPIDPSPSIDPGDDLIDSDEGNLLLEPGSGAPDVKKIMARVRASQKKDRPAGQDIEPGTPDYIAAARRAAQAAAMEVEAARDEQEKPRSPKVKKGKTKAAAPEKVKAEKTVKAAKSSDGTSLMAKYRRPVLLAAGAVLLVVMAMPLVNTLLNGAKAPQIEEQAIAPAEAPATATMDAPQADAPAAPEATAPQPDQMQESAPADAAPTGDKSELAPLPQDGSQSGAAAGPVDDATQPAMADMNQDAAAEPASAAPAVAAQPEIVVPSEISPPSLVEAAKSGDPLALFEIGARYSEGRGVKTSMEQAAVWYKLSADRGFAPAEYRLANLYEKGSGVATDMNKAREYYEKAAEAGNASSMHNLAVLLASGAFGAPDFGAAATWFEKAANMGVADSQFNLAILYARGSGVKQSLEESYKWFTIAAKDGDKDAAQKRDEVANAMRPDQIDAAKAEVELWKPEPLDDNANSIEVPDEWAGKGLKTATVDMGKAIRNIQALLNKNGFDAGPVDGQMGGKTVAAIKAFQTKHGQEPTGKITDEFVREILALNK